MRETSWLGFILYVIINIASCREKLEEYEAKKLTHEGDELVRLHTIFAYCRERLEEYEAVVG